MVIYTSPNPAHRRTTHSPCSPAGRPARRSPPTTHTRTSSDPEATPLPSTAGLEAAGASPASPTPQAAGPIRYRHAARPGSGISGRCRDPASWTRTVRWNGLIGQPSRVGGNPPEGHDDDCDDDRPDADGGAPLQVLFVGWPNVPTFMRSSGLPAVPTEAAAITAVAPQRSMSRAITATVAASRSQNDATPNRPPRGPSSSGSRYVRNVVRIARPSRQTRASVISFPWWEARSEWSSESLTAIHRRARHGISGRCSDGQTGWWSDIQRQRWATRHGRRQPAHPRLAETDPGGPARGSRRGRSPTAPRSAASRPTSPATPRRATSPTETGRTSGVRSSQSSDALSSSVSEPGHSGGRAHSRGRSHTAAVSVAQLRTRVPTRTSWMAASPAVPLNVPPGRPVMVMSAEAGRMEVRLMSMVQDWPTL